MVAVPSWESGEVLVHKVLNKHCNWCAHWDAYVSVAQPCTFSPFPPLAGSNVGMLYHKSMLISIHCEVIIHILKHFYVMLILWFVLAMVALFLQMTSTPCYLDSFRDSFSSFLCCINCLRAVGGRCNQRALEW